MSKLSPSAHRAATRLVRNLRRSIVLELRRFNSVASCDPDLLKVDMTLSTADIERIADDVLHDVARTAQLAHPMVRQSLWQRLRGGARRVFSLGKQRPVVQIEPEMTSNKDQKPQISSGGRTGISATEISAIDQSVTCDAFRGGGNRGSWPRPWRLL